MNDREIYYNYIYHDFTPVGKIFQMVENGPTNQSKFDYNTFNRALVELNEYGFIIQRMNFSDVMIVAYNKYI